MEGAGGDPCVIREFSAGSLILSVVWRQLLFPVLAPLASLRERSLFELVDFELVDETRDALTYCAESRIPLGNTTRSCDVLCGKASNLPAG